MTEETAETSKPPWSIHWPGWCAICAAEMGVEGDVEYNDDHKIWREADITGKHLSVLALIAGRDDFDMLEMSPTNGHQRLMMMITACVAVDAAEAVSSGDTDEIAEVVAESVDEVSKASAEKIIGALMFDN